MTTASARLQNLSSQVHSSTRSTPAFEPTPCAGKSDDDVVICSALRTPWCKSRGQFKEMQLEELLAPVIKETLARTKVDPKVIGDMQIGNVLAVGSAVTQCRQALLMAGVPIEVPCMTINRLCSSGLQACANIAGAIKAGQIEVGLAGGFESMSNYDMMKMLDPKLVSEAAMQKEESLNVLLPMGLTSENVAAKYGVSREKQDAMAVASHAKALAFKKSGHMKEEIVPIQAHLKGKTFTVAEDDGMRAGLTAETLAKLKPVFKVGGSTTAGNASQTTDGAGLVLLASRRAAKKYNLPVIGKFVAFSAVGVPAEIMGVGPAAAIPHVLKSAGLRTEDIDLFEVNEAFASQATYCCDSLNLPPEKVNPNGGAIAVGHPLGATGARLVAAALHQLKRTGKKRAICSMCIGTGMGAAGIIEAE